MTSAPPPFPRPALPAGPVPARPVPFSALPPAQGLYDPAEERDACGVAFVVDVQGRRSHRLVEQALTALANLDHRGAAGAEPSSGDGAGMLLQVPDTFLRAVVDFPLPEPDPATGEGGYAVGLAFVPTDAADDATDGTVERLAAEEGLRVLGWRDLPTDPAGLGPTALSVMPRLRQLFVAATDGVTGLALERRAFCLRRRAERETRDAGTPVYFPSLSSRTLVYKGMLTTAQLGTFFRGLGADNSRAEAMGEDAAGIGAAKRLPGLV